LGAEVATIGGTNPHARCLRKEATDAEQRLWYHLRSRNLGGFKFRRQVTIGLFIADFVCLEARLVVEADGGQHGNDRDLDRTKYLEELGWKVIRFWNHDILQQTDAVLEAILLACEEGTRKKPSPNPLPHAGEG